MNQFSVLHLSTYDIAGGAARAAYRIHRSLLGAGVESNMIVRNRRSTDPRVHPVGQSFGRAYSMMLRPLDRRCGKLHAAKDGLIRSYNPVPTFGLKRAARGLAYDAVIVHFTSHGFVTPREIASLRKPIIMVLHSTWPFCGAEEYSPYEERFIAGYRRSNRPAAAMRFDLDRWVWKRKEKAFRNCQISVVGDSHWTTGLSANSALFRGRPHRTIHYPLELDIYRPLDQGHARKLLGLPLDKKIILFGGVAAARDRRKGFDLLLGAIAQTANERADVALVVFGAERPEPPPPFPLETRFLGVLHDDYTLAALYNAADVMVVPSRMEAFGQTALESLACGTPCVAFRTGGLVDIVDHQQNGYLADPLSTGDLARGIRWSLEQHGAERRLTENARAKAEKISAPQFVAAQYMEVLAELLGASRARQH
jgi:glycosyltransferase involved in cell wall biosynthesis